MSDSQFELNKKIETNNSTLSSQSPATNTPNYTPNNIKNNQKIETIDLSAQNTNGYTYKVGGVNLSEINVNKDVTSYVSPQYINSLKASGFLDKDIERVLNNEISIDDLIYEIDNDSDPMRRKQLMKATYSDSLLLSGDELNELELKYRTYQLRIDNLSKQAQFTNDISKKAELQAQISQLNNEIAPTKAKLDNNRYFKQYIDNELNYYMDNVDKYMHKNDFKQNKTMGIDAINTFDSIIAGEKGISKETEYATIISAALNDRVDVFIDGNTVYVDGINHPIMGTDDHYRFFLECANRKLINKKEVDVYNYIYNTEGAEAAYKYLEKNYYEYDNRWLAAKTQEDKEFAQEHEVIASTASVVLSPFEGMNGVVNSISSKVKGEKIARHDVYSKSDVYRSGVSEEIRESGHDKLAFVYDTGMSMADTGVLIGTSVLSGGLTGAGQAVASATIMGSKAYTSTLNDALDRGLSDDKAILLASASGLTETAMESYSLGHLMNLEGKMGAKVLEKGAMIEASKGQASAKLFYAMAGVVSQGIAEGEEEAATEIINYFSDQIISGDLSNYNLQINQNLLSGDTLDIATQKANNASVKQVGLAALGGFLSGVGFGGGKSISTNYNITRDMASGIMNEYDMYATNPNSVSSRLESRQIFEEIQQDNIKAQRQEKIKETIEKLKQPGKFKTFKQNMQETLSESVKTTEPVLTKEVENKYDNVIQETNIGNQTVDEAIEKLTQKQNYSEEVQKVIKPIYESMIKEFGNEQLVFNTLEKTPIISVSNVRSYFESKNGLSINDNAMVNNDAVLRSKGFNHNENHCLYDENTGKYSVVEENTIVVVDFDATNPEKVGTLIHELGHAIKGQNGIQIDGDILTSRNGFIEEKYKLTYENGEVKETLLSEKGIGLEEGLNTILEDKITKEVMHDPNYKSESYQLNRSIGNALIGLLGEDAHIIQEAQLTHDYSKISQLLGEDVYNELIEVTDNINRLVLAKNYGAKMENAMSEWRQVREKIATRRLEDLINNSGNSIDVDTLYKSINMSRFLMNNYENSYIASFINENIGKLNNEQTAELADKVEYLINKYPKSKNLKLVMETIKNKEADLVENNEQLVKMDNKFKHIPSSKCNVCGGDIGADGTCAYCGKFNADYKEWIETNINYLVENYNDIINNKITLSKEQYNNMINLLMNNSTTINDNDYKMGIVNVLSKGLAENNPNLEMSNEAKEKLYIEFGKMISKELVNSEGVNVEFVDPIELNKNVNAVYFDNKILLSRNILDRNIIKGYSTIIHELIHQRQDMWMKHDPKLSFNTLIQIMDKINDAVIGNNYYKDNYKWFNVEMEAFSFQYRDCIEYFNGLNVQIPIEIMNEYTREINTNTYIFNSHLLLTRKLNGTWHNIFDLFDTTIHDRPDIFNMFPQLKSIYKMNDNNQVVRKNGYELLNDQIEPPQDIKNISISENDLNAIYNVAKNQLNDPKEFNYSLNRVTDDYINQVRSSDNRNLVFYHGGLEENFDFNNLDPFRLAQKQNKKGKNYAGFYMYSELNKDGAVHYAKQQNDLDNTNNKGIYKIEIDPNARVLELEQGSILRLTQEELEYYQSLGYDLIAGKNYLGKTEYVLLNKDAIINTEFSIDEVMKDRNTIESKKNDLKEKISKITIENAYENIKQDLNKSLLDLGDTFVGDDNTKLVISIDNYLRLDDNTDIYKNNTRRIKELKEMIESLGYNSLTEYGKMTYEGRLSDIDKEIQKATSNYNFKQAEELIKEKELFKEKWYISPEKQEEADIRAKEIYNHNQEIEPHITEQLQSFETSYAFLMEEDKKLKDPISLSRKLLNIQKTDNLTLDEATFKLKDGLRYTYVIESDKYTNTTRNIIDSLNKQGYNTYTLKNTWNKEGYKGINATFIDNSGNKFEIQFHTEESFVEKTSLTHDVYEIYRNDYVKDEPKEIAKQIQKTFDETLVPPPKVKEIKNIDNSKLYESKKVINNEN